MGILHKLLATGREHVNHHLSITRRLMKGKTGTRILRVVQDQLNRPDCIQGENNF